ncbi:Bifunctional uroporphyrinogen-III synthetase/response regulator domain protein [Frankia canadensis]|uniref:Bifunctional uroporphyrinogen-III synthetase/response regulator domain protein n=1 Tax=Frankia canadensis TaxID=1836972 RepID=A0A2I2KIL9_9ACTN|nr:uroporphyrinogen-III synthase [Frankia canadensis]SNQ45504.1 Bifunctional uroporphyrinogen-III synthetase/response regulator domain protein [Frankia canadensis]SOU52794.1 Bifunctional uroporphyrinogen-III synthetase/response regulator domain protein [Frankia canadensis]
MSDERGSAGSVEPLAGYSVGITAARRREEFGAALARRGARVAYGPAIRIVPLADDSQLRHATERCLAAPLDIAVATTGIGFRGWMDAADVWNLAEPLHKALESAVLLARGPKVRGAIRASGLREAWSPASESSNEVLEHLIDQHDLRGRRVAVQLHGEPLPDLVEALRLAGADVIEVPVYRWIAPEDPAPLRRLIDAVATTELDAVAFTSAPAAISFLRAADEQGLREAVHEALLGPVVAACVGPVTAGPLQAEGIPVIQPPRARLGALVREIVEQVPRRRGQLLPVAGHRLDIRGQAAVVGANVVPLSRAAMALLRRLAERPGHVVTRRELLPPGGGDEHAVEVAVGRLRGALGDPRIIQTVAKRGYRLAFDPERGADDRPDAADWRY